MTIRPILWKYQPRNDGSQNVKIYVHVDGKKKYYSTDIYIMPGDWSRGVVKKSNALHAVLNARIQDKIVELSKHFYAGGTFENTEKKQQKASLLGFIESYIAEVQKGLHQIQISTSQGYMATLNHLKNYTQNRGVVDLHFETINIDFYHSFSAYLKENGCKLSSIGKHIKNVKKFMNEGLERKLHSNISHREKAFKSHKSSNSNKIYLTESEIEKIATLDLSTQAHLERERDRFLASYYLLIRYSDSVRLRQENFFEEAGQWYFRNISKKTRKESIVPVKPTLLTILQKQNFNLSGDTNQEANRKLKVIAAMAGITTEAKEGDKPGMKCTFVTTHTARRSGATNLYLQGVSIKIICDLGGWESAETLQTYLRASGLESAKAARNLDFFK